MGWSTMIHRSCVLPWCPYKTTSRNRVFNIICLPILAIPMAISPDSPLGGVWGIWKRPWARSRRESLRELDICGNDHCCRRRGVGANGGTASSGADKDKPSVWGKITSKSDAGESCISAGVMAANVATLKMDS